MIKERLIRRARMVFTRECFSVFYRRDKWKKQERGAEAGVSAGTEEWFF